MIESGTEVKGVKREMSRDSLMREGVVYEFHYSVSSLPLPWFLEALRGWIMSGWTKLIARFKGLEILYWRLDETEFVWQGRGKSTSIWEEVALATVAIAFQGILLVAGVIMVLKTIFEFVEILPEVIPEVTKKVWPYLALGGLGLLALLFWPRRERG